MAVADNAIIEHRACIIRREPAYAQLWNSSSAYVDHVAKGLYKGPIDLELIEHLLGDLVEMLDRDAAYVEQGETCQSCGCQMRHTRRCSVVTGVIGAEVAFRG